MSVSASARVTVAHIVLGLRVGGLERIVTDLARRLEGDRFRNLVICLDTGGPFQHELEAAGVPVIVIGKRPGGMSLHAIRTLGKILREHDVRIVHMQNPGPHAHGVPAALLARVPVRVYTKQGAVRRDRLRLLRTRVLSLFTDRLVAVSDDTQDEFLRIERVPAGRVMRIRNGIDTAAFTPAARAHVDPSTAVIGNVARLSPEKDHATLLDAFRLTLDELPGARLVIAGDGPCAGALRERAVRLGIADRLAFLGDRRDVASVLRTFDLFTLTSTTEGLPLALLEAMATGLPIVATAVGGNAEAVAPPRCGLIVPPRDPAGLARAYVTILRDPAAAARMGAAARARAVEHFSLEAMAAAYMSLYEQLLQAKRRVA